MMDFSSFPKAQCGTFGEAVDLPRILGNRLAKFPVVLRILLENILRSDPEAGSKLAYFDEWLVAGTSEREIEFKPGRIFMHDTTCVPALVDIAAMRDIVAQRGGDPAALSPVLPVDVSVDHSIAVDRYATTDALDFNMAREFERNAERYRFMKWASDTLEGLRVHPPGTGIMHTINLEQVATVVTRRDGQVYPDTLIGTDSHTPMVNGIGVLGWGVGGLEAESVMFGEPVAMRIPDVIGVRLTGAMPPGCLATDLALRVTSELRRFDVENAFVEFFGPGVSTLPAGTRSVIANMAPEYGAATGYFPIDDHTLRYLADTGRSPEHILMVETYARQNGLWHDPAAEPRYTAVLEIDLASIKAAVAGPTRPQDLVGLSETGTAIDAFRKEPAAGSSSFVAIAAITSCTNTSDRRLTFAAGILARKARKLGLLPPPWVKTSFAPGSPTAERALDRAGLSEDLAALGFGIVAHGCTTCIGNSGSLAVLATEMIARDGALPVAVLSGNRNFPGRVHPDIQAGFLASPPLVIAYALAGRADIDISKDPIGSDESGNPVKLADIWPSEDEIEAALAIARAPAEFATSFAEASANPRWRELDIRAGELFDWSKTSTYLRPPPFASASESRLGGYEAYPMIVLGDDVTTDHISPAGQIRPAEEAGGWLLDNGEKPTDLSVYAARRGNWEVMLRGLFMNKTAKNLICPDALPGMTIDVTTGDVLPLWKAAARYYEDGRNAVLVAGERYGMGSSRDWAAKGLALLGIRAVLAVSIERIHRSNLIGMGILPLQIPPEYHPRNLKLAAGDKIFIQAEAAALAPQADIPVRIVRKSGTLEFLARAAVETQAEVDILREGGIIPRLISRVLESPRSAA